MKELKRAFPTILIFLILSLAVGCSLIPPEREYYVRFIPDKNMLTKENYYIDPEDSSVVFDYEGMKVKVKHLTDKELNDEFPDKSYKENPTNPYTYGTKKDPEKGYVPPRFTVFQVTVINHPFAKVQFDPAKAVLITDRGDKLYYYDILERDAKHGNSFEKYYRSRMGRSGNEKFWYEERMGLVRSTLYRSDAVFKGDKSTGKLVFDPLHPEVKHVKLIFNDFVIRFDPYGTPLDTIDIEFDFDVKQGVITPSQAKKR